MYKITITEVTRSEVKVSKWQKVRELAADDPSGKARTHEYVDGGTEKQTVESQIFEQTVESLDISAVVSVINKIGQKE